MTWLFLEVYFVDVWVFGNFRQEAGEKKSLLFF